MRKFDEEHQKAFGLPKAPQYGYPDSGNGRYAKQLPYADWYKMNNGQRAQINFLEQITFILVCSLVASLSFPEYAFWLQIGFIVGRFLFTVGYTSSGPNARLPGALIMDVCILAALVLSGMTIYK